MTVTVPNDSLAEEYPEFQEGEEAVITEENAETFLRWRDTNQTQSALDRMERQQAFLKAFGETVLERYAGNPQGWWTSTRACPPIWSQRSGTAGF